MLKSINQKDALQQLQKLAASKKMQVQYKDSNDKAIPIRVLNSSKQVIATGTLSKMNDGISAKDLQDTMKVLKGLNASVGSSVSSVDEFAASVKQVLGEKLRNFHMTRRNIDYVELSDYDGNGTYSVDVGILDGWDELEEMNAYVSQEGSGFSKSPEEIVDEILEQFDNQTEGLYSFN